MTVYIAGRYSRRLELAERAKELTALGLRVTSRWLSGCHDFPDLRLPDDAKLELKREYARQDVEDVLSADAIVAFTEAPRSVNDSRGGRHVEFGIALASGKRIILVGLRENIFHFLPGIEHFPEWDDALAVFRQEGVLL